MAWWRNSSEAVHDTETLPSVASEQCRHGGAVGVRRWCFGGDCMTWASLVLAMAMVALTELLRLLREGEEEAGNGNASAEGSQADAGE